MRMGIVSSLVGIISLPSKVTGWSIARFQVVGRSQVPGCGSACCLNCVALPVLCELVLRVGAIGYIECIMCRSMVVVGFGSRVKGKGRGSECIWRFLGLPV